MTFYWFMFLIPAFAALQFSRPHYGPRGSFTQGVLWFVALVALTFTIGLRHEVGGDWWNYLPYVEAAENLTFQEAIKRPDPGYSVLNWLGANLGGGIYLVNTICGLLLSFGLVVFCRQLPRPWLAFAVAMPYLVLVVGMGYSRQGVALGLAMWGLALLLQGKLWRFIAAITMAGLFHKSAIALILIALAARTQNRLLTAVAVLGIGAGLYLLLMADAVDALRVGYLEAEYQSAGADVRVAMNALPGMLFLLIHKRLVLNEEQRQLWKYLSLVAVGFVGLLAVSPSSTAVDRVALYLIPLQLFVMAHLPDALGRVGRRNIIPVMTVLAYYLTVLFVWLFFAHHRHGWIPYQFYPLETL